MINWSNVEKVVTEEEIKHQNDIRLAKEYLSETDWYVMRFVETGKAIPEDIQVKRDEARLVIE